MAIAIRLQRPPSKLLPSNTTTTTSSPSTTNPTLLTLLTRLLLLLRTRSLSHSHSPPPPPQPWPSHPFPLIHSTGANSRSHHSPIPEAHFCIRTAQLMAQTHNTIFRALNAIHAQASSSSRQQDVLDLLHFVLITCAFITNHHESEERAFFPLIEAYCEKPGLMGENVRQHEVLEGDLESLRGYVEGVLVAVTAAGKGGGDGGYRAEELRRRVEGLAGSLGGHMREEIGCILGLHEWVPSSVLEGIYKKMHHEAAGGMDKWKAGPFVFGCQDADFLLDGEKIPFPEVPVPYIVPFIIDQIVARRHSGAWRFCPSSAYGRPRPFTGRPLESQSSLLLGQGSVLRALIGWLILFFLAYQFGAYVRTIS